MCPWSQYLKSLHLLEAPSYQSMCSPQARAPLVSRCVSASLQEGQHDILGLCDRLRALFHIACGWALQKGCKQPASDHVYQLYWVQKEDWGLYLLRCGIVHPPYLSIYNLLTPEPCAQSQQDTGDIIQNDGHTSPVPYWQDLQSLLNNMNIREEQTVSHNAHYHCHTEDQETISGSKAHHHLIEYVKMIGICKHHWL